MKPFHGITFALLGATMLPATAAEPLGRLFFTPERRVALEQGRNSPAMTAAPAETGTTMSLDGVVRRSQGPATVWVNGRAQLAGPGGQGGSSIQLEKSYPGARIGGGEEVAPAALTVGERINRITQEKTDLVPRGAITPGDAGPK